MQLRANTERLIFAGAVLPGGRRSGSSSGFFFSLLASSIEREWGEKKLDLSLCAFNYERLAGLQPPETRGEASTSGAAATPMAAQYQLKHLRTHREEQGGGSGLIQGSHV